MSEVAVSHGAKKLKLLLLGGVILLAAAAVAFFLLRTESAQTGPSYELSAIQRGSISARVTATGTLSPLVTVQVGSQVSGRIQELFADFNSRVKKGQLLAKIDPQLFISEETRAKAALSSARAGLAKANAELDNAKVAYERSRALAAKRLVAEAEADAARATFRSAEAQVAAARASVEEAKAALEKASTNLAYTQIVSPIDGIVISRDVDVGQTVAASLQTPTIFTIAEDLKKMEVHTSVAESDVGRIAAEMPVEFTVDAYPTERFHGVVKEVRYAPQTLQNVVTYDAVVSVENDDLKLRPGMTADVTFLVQERSNVLLVPNAALRFHPPGIDASRTKKQRKPQARVVFVVGGDGRPSPVDVEIGITDGQRTEITSGDLSEGDEVIVGISGESQRGPGEKEKPRFGRFL